MEKYYVAVISAPKHIGIASVRKLLDYFGNAESVWFAESAELEQAGLSKTGLQSFLEFREKNPYAPEKLIDYCDANGIGLCSIVDDDYPPILKEIQSPPAVIYYYGELQPSAERIAMVGTRKFTNYGKQVAADIAEGLAAAGITVVSGAAKGIDTFSHMGAMKYGRTVAVLGCGISFAFKSANRDVIKEITEKGVVMTEYVPSQPSTKETFPPRNRIIAGLCRGVIVVEAGIKSGALITCDYAGDYGRDVFAVPGKIYEDTSAGCNELIRDGAILVRSAEDVLEFYNFKIDKKPVKEIVNNETVKLEGIEKKVFDAIPSGDFITDEEILMAVDAIESKELPSILLQLEIKNFIVEKDRTYSRR